MRHLLSLFGFMLIHLWATSAPTVGEPILPGFNPDPSICRVDSDYYLVTSSFMFSPGLPIYHSRDLHHWQLVGHAVDEHNIDKFQFGGLTDNDGFWAPTLRHHDGMFYLICTLHGGGGDFVLTARDPRGPWSDPVWIPMAQGIDPTLFWDTDGRSYYVGNRWDQPHQWTGQVAVWLQEIDLSQTVEATISEPKRGLTFTAPTYRLVGQPSTLSFGHAANARYAEGPHLYRIGRRYCLLMAEGGSGKYHAVTVHWADSLRGPYAPQQVNPVLTTRHLGRRHPVQNVGHADLVDTPDGGFAAVCLANRMLPLQGQPEKPYVSYLGRETWLVDAVLDDGQLYFDMAQTDTAADRQTAKGSEAKTEYTPLTDPSLRLQKLEGLQWQYRKTIGRRSKEHGIVVFRTINSHYDLLRDGQQVRLMLTAKGQQRQLATVECGRGDAELRVEANGATLRFYVGGQQIADDQSIAPLCDDGKYNKFNGTGVGYRLR